MLEKGWPPVFSFLYVCMHTDICVGPCVHMHVETDLKCVPHSLIHWGGPSLIKCVPHSLIYWGRLSLGSSTPGCLPDLVPCPGLQFLGGLVAIFCQCYSHLSCLTACLLYLTTYWHQTFIPWHFQDGPIPGLTRKAACHMWAQLWVMGVGVSAPASLVLSVIFEDFLSGGWIPRVGIIRSLKAHALPFMTKFKRWYNVSNTKTFQMHRRGIIVSLPLKDYSPAVRLPKEDFKIWHWGE